MTNLLYTSLDFIFVKAANLQMELFNCQIHSMLNDFPSPSDNFFSVNRHENWDIVELNRLSNNAPKPPHCQTIIDDLTDI
jgi:hypothetical protein